MGELEMVVWMVVMYRMVHMGSRACLGCGAMRGLLFFLALRLVSHGSICVSPACCNSAVLLELTRLSPACRQV